MWEAGLLFADIWQGGPEDVLEVFVLEPYAAADKELSVNPDEDFCRGMPCHGELKLRNGRDDDPMLIEAGIVGVEGLPLPRFWRDRIRRDLWLAVMGEDAADGVVTLRGGRLRIRYDEANSPVFARAREMFRQIAEASGRPVRVDKKPFTVHPLGGAVLGSEPAKSVVGGTGEVHGHPGLFVLDAAALPRAPGSPPSMTIAAWASWVAGRFVDTRA